jgi:hypothetical protein
MFLIVGHTKNVADRSFNITKILYRKLNIYTLTMLGEALNTADQVDCCTVDHTEFRDWDTFVSKFAKDKLESVKKWQIFKVSDKKKGVMTKLSSNLPDATKERILLYLQDTNQPARCDCIYRIPISAVPRKPWYPPNQADGAIHKIPPTHPARSSHKSTGVISTRSHLKGCSRNSG